MMTVAAKKIVLLIGLLMIGCSNLGFGEFDDSSENKNTETTSKSTEKIPVKFSYQPLIGGKHEVFIAGDFNNWIENETLMKEEDGIYEIILYLKPGKYSYKYIVDGQWLTDPNAIESIDDGYGGDNSIIYVGDKKDIDAFRKVDFTYEPSNIVKEVYLVGSMNDWNLKSDRMLEIEKGVYSISLLLKPGEYEYKFLEDGMNWITDPKSASLSDDGFGGKNAILIVDDRFDKIVIEKGDGIFLNYGIPTSQSLETVNPLSSLEIEFKAKSHINDVENIYLIKNNESINMNKINQDGTYDYFQKILMLESEDDEFDYCFMYSDGDNNFYLLDGGFSTIKDESRYFHYSKNNVRPFFTPDWVKNGVIYQIFPERFYNGNKDNDPDFKEWYYDGINIGPKNGVLLEKYTEYYHLEDDWYDYSGLSKSPYHLPNNDGHQPDYNSFYGGDIQGIKQKLDYLEDLGITIIYFNPLFEAKSNHKYDAVDYMKIDPHFGSNEEFKSFVKEAHKRGIRVIIDCAFNHTGETFWAFQESMKNGPNSKYYDWYEWKKWPLPKDLKNPSYKPIDYYECWWGYGHMPNLNFDYSNPNQVENSIKNIDLADPNWEVVNYVLDVAEFWVSEMDIDGFRLDVPNEVPFWFWELFREKVKSIKPDAYLVGELWSNAVDWVNDDYYDAVMNYAYFKDPVMRFFNSRQSNAMEFDRDLKQGLLSYPTQATQVMMNLIDSHDTFRYLESCNGDISKLEIAVLFQMTYVGAPHIWYGNEIGMMGGHDPDCRRPFDWKYIDNSKQIKLREFYKKLIKIRKENSCLRTGNFKTLIADGMIYAYLRSDNESSINVVLNNDTKSHNIEIPIEGDYKVDLISGKKYLIENGILNIDIDAMTGVILK